MRRGCSNLTLKDKEDGDNRKGKVKPSRRCGQAWAKSGVKPGSAERTQMPTLLLITVTRRLHATRANAFRYFSSTGFLSHGFDIWGWRLPFWGAILEHHRLFNRTPSLYPLDANNTSLTLQGHQNISRRRQMSQVWVEGGSKSAPGKITVLDFFLSVLLCAPCNALKTRGSQVSKKMTTVSKTMWAWSKEKITNWMKKIMT